MSVSKITANYRITLPKAVRKALKLEVGDSLVFQVVGKRLLILRKPEPIDNSYNGTLSPVFNHWQLECEEELYDEANRAKLKRSGRIKS